MRPPKDYTGKKYGKLTAIRHKGFRPVKDEWGNVKRRDNLWVFECECGNKTVAMIHNVVSGNTKSCGCLIPPAWLDYHRFGRYERN